MTLLQTEDQKNEETRYFEQHGDTIETNKNK